MKGQLVARYLIAPSLLVLLPVAVLAQSATTGAIAGVVRDTTGAVLPGVTVEAASPALIEKVRTAVTDAQGNYKIVDLRPGTYTVTFTLSGFGIFKREGLELTTGFTATANAEMKVGTLEETVTVTGASPVVDIQNVRTQSVLSREVLDSVPAGGKTIQSYAALVPGVILPADAQDVGGNKGEFATALAVHGNRAGDQKLLQDGMGFNAMEGGGGGAVRFFFINHASTQEVTLETGGISAESETGGIQINAVPKEGSNSFKLSSIVNYTNGDLQNGNISDTLRARGLSGTQTLLKKVYDLGIGLGGPILKDRLWFHTAHRWWGAQQNVPGLYFNSTQDSWFYTPDLSRPAYLDDYNRDNNIRLTWQASPKNKINLSYNAQDNCNCYYLFFGGGPSAAPAGGLATPEATTAHHYTNPNYLAQATWSYPASNRLLFEAGVAAMIITVHLDRQPEVSPDDIAVLELSTNLAYRAKTNLPGVTPYGYKESSQVNERFAVSYITGSHAFKTGLYLQQGWRNAYSEINRDVLYTFRNGVPVSLTQWATPVLDRNRVLPNLGIYAQDQWKVQNLTLNLGLRFDYFRAYDPATTVPLGRFVPARNFARVDDVPNWKDVSPRLGAAYDLFGSGRTALKVSLGRYVEGAAAGIASQNNPVNAMVTNATRTWSDANGDFIPQEQELGPLSDAAFGSLRITRRFADDVLRGFGKRGYNWQSSVSMQHELKPGIALNAGYFRTWYGNFTINDNLEVTPADYDQYCFTAPRDPRLPGGGGNQICRLYDVKPGRFGRVNTLVTHAADYGEQSEVYNGVDLTINARFGNGKLVSGGVSTGRTVTDRCFVVDSPQEQRFCRVTMPFKGQTQVKLSGIYPLLWGLETSAVFQNLPGIPVAASYVATNEEIAPSLGRNLASGARGFAIVDLMEPNTLFEDRMTQVDVRLTKIVKVGRARVQGMFDVYNVFNASPVLVMTTRFGPAWLRPSQILAGRLFKFGAQVDF